MEPILQKPGPNLVALFVDWLLIGIQSFGGGASAFSLIHQVAIKRGWLSEEEFVRDWALVQISPGINLVKLTVMIGYSLMGWPGILACTSGLLLPSALVTVLMTAGFTTIRSVPWIQAIMKGIIPATVGLSMAMGLQMAQPIFSSAWKDGRLRLGEHFGILVCAALLMGFTQISPLFILLLAGIAAVVLFYMTPAHSPELAPRDIP